MKKEIRRPRRTSKEVVNNISGVLVFSRVERCHVIHVVDLKDKPFVVVVVLVELMFLLQKKKML